MRSGEGLESGLYTRPVRRTLIVTNDFPPRQGGIQSFVHGLATRLPPGTVVVYAPAWGGAAEFDARQPFPVIRHPTSLMLPVRSVSRRAAAIAREHSCDTVLFGAAAPLGLITPALRGAGVTRAVALTHGHEAGWAALPVARGLLRRIGDEVDVVTYLGEYFRGRLARALSPTAAQRMVRLTPGVDVTFFRPGAGGDAVRQRLGLGHQPVVVCVSRLVRRKGQDTLIRAWPLVRAEVSDAVLLLVGDGPYAGRLRRLADRLGVSDCRPVHRTGPMARTPRLLRHGRRVRHAVPDPAGRTRRRGPGHRLPGGLGHRPAGNRRRLGRSPRRDPRGRIRLRRHRRGRHGGPHRRTAHRSG